jgi:RNA polymerase sigma-70 factor (ECF subfamily)
MRKLRPQTVRQFFALANQHIRWELNDLARRLGKGSRAAPLNEALVAAPESSGGTLSPDSVRMLDEIERLPEEEREVFSLVRIQGMSQPEVARLLEISVKTVQRRLNHSVVLLTERLSDLGPSSAQTPPSAAGDTNGG